MDRLELNLDCVKLSIVKQCIGNKQIPMLVITNLKNGRNITVSKQCNTSEIDVNEYKSLVSTGCSEDEARIRAYTYFNIFKLITDNEDISTIEGSIIDTIIVEMLCSNHAPSFMNNLSVVNDCRLKIAGKVYRLPTCGSEMYMMEDINNMLKVEMYKTE